MTHRFQTVAWIWVILGLVWHTAAAVPLDARTGSAARDSNPAVTGAAADSFAKQAIAAGMHSSSGSGAADRTVTPTAHALPAAVARPSDPDTMRLQLEVGAGTDVTNELYYEDAFVDTTFLERRLVSSPESRVAGLLRASLVGTRGQRTTSYQLLNDLSVGDRVQRDALTMMLRHAIGPDWKLSMRPALELRHDQTFDRDLEEWRAAFSGRLRRMLAEGLTSADLGWGADLLRTRGRGTDFLLDRNSANAALALDHLGLLGDEWRLELRGVRRVFPDSVERDHDELRWEASARWMTDAGHGVGLEASGARRGTLRIASTSRDNFWSEEGALDGTLRIADPWSVRGRLEAEALQYDLEDEVLFFDYQVLRGRLGLRFERGGGWFLTAGPRAEALFSRLAPGEGYREIGLQVESELWNAGSWWSLTPAAGWRDYESPADASASYPEVHSAFIFWELDAIVDQALAARLRLRGVGTLRIEEHTEASQDARSLYLSMELRWQL
jgi:hypothetical protein